MQGRERRVGKKKRSNRAKHTSPHDLNTYPATRRGGGWLQGKRLSIGKYLGRSATSLTFVPPRNLCEPKRMDMFHPPMECLYYIRGYDRYLKGGENEFHPRFDPPRWKFIPTTLIRSHRSRWRIEEKFMKIHLSPSHVYAYTDPSNYPKANLI